MQDTAAAIETPAAPAAQPAQASRPGGPRDRVIARAVNVLGVVLVALLALYLGGALHVGDTRRAVALAGLSAVVLTLVLSPDVGLLLWMLMAPFGRLFNLSQGRGLPDLSLNRIASIGLLFILAAQAISGRRKLARLTAVEGWGIAFILALILSISTSRLGWVSGVQLVFDAVAVPLLCFYFARNLFTDRRQLAWLAVMLAIIGATLGVIAAREQLTNQAILSPTPYRMAYGQYSIKVTSLFGAPAAMALALSVPIPIVFVAAMRSRSLAARMGWLVSLTAIVFGLLSTYVRAGWLAGAAGLVVVVLLCRRARTAGLVMLLVALLAALFLGGGFVDTRAIEERLQSEGSISYREQALRVGLELAVESPVLGLGLDNYSEAAASAGWQPRRSNATLVAAPHNMYLYVLASGGLLALAPFLAQLIALGWRALTVLRRSRHRAGAGDATGGDKGDWAAAAIAMVISYALFIGTFDAITAQFATVLFLTCLGAIFGAIDTRPPVLQPVPARGSTEEEEKSC